MIKANATDFKSDKIIDFKTAAKKILELKKTNKTVGLCHGGFDLLHPGHIKHLESAKKFCDYLFVSITSDKFVRSNKGDNRPIFSEVLRAYSVANIKWVDYVVISNYRLAIQVLEILKPNLYIKGPDYVNDTRLEIKVERDKIRKLGGEIKYTTDQKLSTSDIIKRIQNL